MDHKDKALVPVMTSRGTRVYDRFGAQVRSAAFMKVGSSNQVIELNESVGAGLGILGNNMKLLKRLCN